MKDIIGLHFIKNVFYKQYEGKNLAGGTLNLFFIQVMKNKTRPEPTYIVLHPAYEGQIST